MSDPRDRMLRVRLAPEWYLVDPVWIQTPDAPILEDVPPMELTERYGVPTDISVEIEAWDREFQDTYRSDDPRESGFADAGAAERWERRGMAVARRLAAELGPSIPVEIAAGGGMVQVDLGVDPP